LVLDVRKLDPQIESKFRSFILAKFGRRKKGEVSRIVEISLEYYLEHSDQIEEWKKKKEILKKTLKASANF